MISFTIGQVAKQAGVGVETVRYYEREGLLEQAKRKASGYRQFDERVIDRLRFIRRAKELGFTLKEIKELIHMQVDPTITCVDVKSRAEIKIIDIENRIRSLQKMKKALVKLAKTCEGKGPASDCVILESLQPEKNN
ncbi:Transcriptional regulator, MerR family [hydrothermal vent metagenome]|uniref:Transcriptional regulator, MerR family n=1 Tax=hydrothermal vent metagenome TaxID=652676 RepID=A0A3B1E8F9_9ZZZZ